MSALLLLSKYISKNAIRENEATTMITFLKNRMFLRGLEYQPTIGLVAVLEFYFVQPTALAQLKNYC
jgi:hypothetical protein